MKHNKVATTIKLEESLYDGFKVLGVRHKVYLQSLVEKSIYRYVNDPVFRDQMNEFIIPIPTGEPLPTSSSIV